ncbi:uncharacterized protein [Dermacentor albipictus]|uniref:uncharacterized protein isoform X3 n=1 Tax=Dermacentor albipictus TaxID=60249 RepID=UPI0038FD1174
MQIVRVAARPLMDEGPAWEAARWPTLPAAPASGLVTWWPAVIEHRYLDAQPVGQLVSSSIGLVSWCPHCRLGDPLFWRPGDCPCCGPAALATCGLVS